MKNIALIILTIFLLTSCRQIKGDAFYNMATLDMRVPDGPEEYQAGWHAGCRSALSNRDFANGAVYREANGAPTMGSGIYQHSSIFQGGWANGWFACIIHMKTYMNGSLRSLAHGPLQ